MTARHASAASMVGTSSTAKPAFSNAARAEHAFASSAATMRTHGAMAVGFAPSDDGGDVSTARSVRHEAIHLRMQQVEVDRLGQEAVDAATFELLANLVRKVSGQGDHLDRVEPVALAEQLKNLYAVVHRHVDVEDDEPKIAARAHLERLVAVGRCCDVIAVFFEEIGKKLSV